MDLLSLIYSFVILTGASTFVVNEATYVADDVVQVDVETLNLKPENHRYILLVDHGKVTQHVRVPLTEAECKAPH